MHQRLTLPVLSLGTVHTRCNDHQELHKHLLKHLILACDQKWTRNVAVLPHLGSTGVHYVLHLDLGVRTVEEAE